MPSIIIIIIHFTGPSRARQFTLYNFCVQLHCHVIRLCCFCFYLFTIFHFFLCTNFSFENIYISLNLVHFHFPRWSRNTLFLEIINSNNPLYLHIACNIIILPHLLYLFQQQPGSTVWINTQINVPSIRIVFVF